MTLWTIGHSTRTIEELTSLLRENGLDFVVDIRTVPRSRTNPQYNRDSLPGAMARYGIGYGHLAALSGLRARRKDRPSPNAGWRNASFRNYADYAMTHDFAAGLAELRRLEAEHRAAMMCAEAVWWRCHRRIVADYLIAAGDQVVHILGPGKAEPARMTAGAERQPDGTLVYPAAAEA